MSMTEYINQRKLLLRLMQNGCPASVLDIVMNFPAVDTMLAVRCQVCCFGQKDDIGVMHCHKYHCHKKADGFCDEGEQMDGKGEDA